MAQVASQHEAVERSYDAEFERGQLGHYRLYAAAVFAHNIAVVPSGLGLPATGRVGHGEGAERIGRE